MINRQMTKQQKDNFQKFYDFMMKLHYKKFDYRNFVTKWDSKNECGTICCAAGYLPIIFPNTFFYMATRNISVGADSSMDIKLRDFFGLNLGQQKALFYGLPYTPFNIEDHCNILDDHIMNISLKAFRKEILQPMYDGLMGGNS